MSERRWHQPLTSNHGQSTLDLERAYEQLAEWCRKRDFAGYDPFDGLNSRLFQATPLRRSRTIRLVWTQFFKRSPVNLRRLAGVPVERNAKGTALFALAALARFRMHRSKEAAGEACELIGSLLAERINGWSGAAWGYNFDWQGRAFYAPRGTPTIVPTAFAVRALVEAARAFGEERYTAAARSSCHFILHDLHRSIETEDELCFSYSPLDQTRVFNASLLAAETLASVSHLTGEQPLREVALRATRYVVRRMRPDGSWAYGAEDYQSWMDSFHTAFVLTSLARIAATCDAGEELMEALRSGYHFWRISFFLADGWPKYYHD
ncbi:MAG: delta-aminolevulinic acid dehydratase, partial [Pyrinomonadaceae bacterium]|nr:delta-aminolevulinic acid dehydratase [Pyrinomonadaceae bacterium]